MSVPTKGKRGGKINPGGIKNPGSATPHMAHGGGGKSNVKIK
jgi:hypothetical protein